MVPHFGFPSSLSHDVIELMLHFRLLHLQKDAAAKKKHPNYFSISFHYASLSFELSYKETNKQKRTTEVRGKKTAMV